MILTHQKLVLRVMLAGMVLAGVMTACLWMGSQDVKLQEVLKGPVVEGAPNVHYVIFMQERLPRIGLAAIVGAALACCGVVFQAILRNPLADPYILGISSGAGLGSMVAVMLGWTWAIFGMSAIMVAAFIGAMLTIWLVWGIGQVTGRANVTGLLLAGVVVNAFFSALIMFLSSIAKADKLQMTIFWLMGNMNVPQNAAAFWAAGGVVVAGIVFLLMLSNQLNILSFGSEDARNLGVSVNRTCFLAFACAALITSVAVSLSGLIGFVGLIIPHAVRLVAGPDHRQLIPLSAIVGAAFLVIADAAARVVIAPAILPVGVVTALTGGPFFLILLMRYTKTVHWGRS
jgi:iron complex transport system permease protein